MPRSRGGGLAGLLGDVLADVLTKHKAVSLPAEKAAQARLVKAVMEQSERELAPTLQAVFAGVIDHPDLPPETRRILQDVTHPKHQAQVFALVGAVIGLVIGASQAIVEPLVRPLAQGMNARYPNVVLTPEQLAAGFIRGLVSGQEGIDQARRSGLDEDRYAVLVGLVGNPPATQDLLEAYRRGIITKAQLEHGIQQGDLRNEWIPTIEALRFAPLTPSIAVAGAVENQVSIAEARHLAGLAGMAPADFDLAYKVAGRPPGIVETLELLQRGDATEADFRQVVAESDVKTKYTDLLLKLRRRLLPPDTIATMVGHGVLDERGGIRKLMEHGFTHEDAALWVARASQQATQQLRDLTVGEITTLYEGQAINRADAEHLLGMLGYNRESVGLLLDLADARRLRAARDQAIARVHALYVASRIDRSEADAALDRLGLASTHKRELVRIWDLERAANTRDLTKQEIAGAYGRGIFSLAQAKQRLEGIGYRGEDAAVILAQHAPPEARDRTLSAAQVIASVKRKALTRDDGLTRLQGLGYSDGDARLLLTGVS